MMATTVLSASSSFSSWLHMDGDGVYVWPCYLITLLVMLANVWVVRNRARVLRNEVLQQAQRDRMKEQPGHRITGGTA